MPDGISVIIPVYNGGKTIEETLKSVVSIADEVLVVHDGECTDNTLKIARKYKCKIFVRPHKGRSAFPFAYGLTKAKSNWILKLDDDESLSKELQNNIRKLIKSKDADAYSFIHPLWDGKKTITKTWPRKTILVRKSKLSYLGFPGFDMSLNTTGVVQKTDYVMYHKPYKNQDVGWDGYREKVLGRYAHSQSKNLFMPFEKFPKFQYVGTDLPLKLRLRKIVPILSNIPYAFLVFFKQLFVEGAIKEGRNGFHVALKTLLYNLYLGYLLQKEKFKRTFN